MRVAILGAGFAGLAVTWFLLHYTKGSATIDLFDPEPIGGGASGISSGLLHPFTGKQAKLAWRGKRCIEETHRLITEASRAIGKTLILSKGILRPALSPQQIHDFQASAAAHSDETAWWDKATCEEKIPGLRLPETGGGLFIKEGLTLDVPSYLQGLWQACALLGTQWRQQAMIKPSALEAYDRILVAMGPLSKNFPLLKNLPISAVKGQMLELKWPENTRPLPYSLVSQKYVVMLPDQKSCLAGATYEHTFASPLPDQTLAVQEIMPQVAAFFPALAHAEVVGCRSAFRATTPSHLPLLGRASEKYYFLTGLGSKGLLYHAWLGKRMARAILTGNTEHFPPEVHYSL